MTEEYKGFKIWTGWVDPMYTNETCVCVSRLEEGTRTTVFESEVMPYEEQEVRWNELASEMKKKIDELIEKEKKSTK